MSNSNKHKHLDLISQAIGRMGQNSFTVRGWCVTAVTAVIAFAVEANSALMASAALIPIAMFWTIDAYYLHQERGFRALYNKVRVQEDSQIDYEMSPVHKSNLLRVMFDAAIFFFLYAGLGLVVCTIALVLALPSRVEKQKYEATIWPSALSSSSLSVRITRHDINLYENILTA